MTIRQNHAFDGWSDHKISACRAHFSEILSKCPAGGMGHARQLLDDVEREIIRRGAQGSYADALAKPTGN